MNPNEMTFNEHINAALEIASTARGDSMRIARDQIRVPAEKRAGHDAAARDLSLSITRLEDAATRYNSARYHQAGTWQRADPDRQA